MKIKYLLLGLLTPLFVSFCSAYNISQENIDYINSIALKTWSNINTTAWYFDLYQLSNPDANIYRNLCVLFSWFNLTNTVPYVIRFSWELWTNSSANIYVSSLNYNLYCNSWWRKYFQISFKNSVAFTIDYYWVFDAEDLINRSLSVSDCSSVESELATMSWNYNTCLSSLNEKTWLLTTCQNDLASCSNSCDTLVSQCMQDKSTLQTSLSGCVEDKASLQNYNDSLSSQLQDCLMTNTSWNVITWFILNQYSLFWKDWGVDYSLPITNSLFLPNWLKAKINSDNVLSIAKANSIETAYNITDEDFKNNVFNNFSVVYLFLFSCGLFLIFIYAIRRYFIWLKSIK